MASSAETPVLRGSMSRLKKHVYGLLRVSAVISVIVALGGALAWRKAAAATLEASARLDPAIEGLDGMIGRPAQILFNGNTFFASARHVARPVEQVVNILEKRCSDFGWDADLPAQGEGGLVGSTSGDEGQHSLTMAKNVSDGRSVVVCLTSSTKQRGFANFAERLRHFLKTGDMSRLGELHYFVAKKGSSSGTTLLSVWTRGGLNIRTLLGDGGEAPGSDSSEVSRPADSRKIMQLELADSAYALRSYSSSEAADVVLKQAGDSLSRRGWIVPPDAAPQPGTFTFMKGGAAILLMASATDWGSSLDIVELGSRGSVPVFEGRPP